MNDLKRRKINSNEDETTECQESINRFKNCIYFNAGVSAENVNKLLILLHEASSEAVQNETSYIWLYIHSIGGDAFSGFSAMDHIQNNGIPVITVADGVVASAATFILLAGYRRFTMPHAHILIHQVQTEFSGKYKELLDDVCNTRSIMSTMKKIYKEKTNLKGKKLNAFLYGELYMTGEKSIEHGLVEDFYSWDLIL